MANTLNDVLTKVSAVVSQETSVTDTSSEYALWRSYANMAQNEWAETYDWSSLYVESNTKTTYLGTNANGSTIALPADFRKLAGYPRITADQTNSPQYPEIDPFKKGQYQATDEFCYPMTGADSSKYLIVNPGTFASGVSVFVPYWRSVSSLASPADEVLCDNPDYLAQRIIAYVWEAREDGRFMQAKAEAEKILARMIEFDVAKGPGYDLSIQTPEQRNYSFRIGKD